MLRSRRRQARRQARRLPSPSPRPTIPTSTRPPVPGPPCALQVQPAWPGAPWNGAISTVVVLPSSSFANTATSLLTISLSRSAFAMNAVPPAIQATGASSPGLPKPYWTVLPLTTSHSGSETLASPSTSSLSVKMRGPTESITTGVSRTSETVW